MVEMIAFSTTNDGTYSWNVLSYLTDGTDYQILISDLNDLSVSDYSDYFEIYTYIEPKSIIITAPTNADAWETGTTHTISWTSTGTITNVKIDLYLSGAFLKTIVATTSNHGSYPWTKSSSLVNSTFYQIRISDASEALIFDDSVYFEIVFSKTDNDNMLQGIPGYDVIIPLICLLGVSAVFIKIWLKRVRH